MLSQLASKFRETFGRASAMTPSLWYALRPWTTDARQYNTVRHDEILGEGVEKIFCNGREVRNCTAFNCQDGWVDHYVGAEMKRTWGRITYKLQERT
jgi:hypothetical protein